MKFVRIGEDTIRLDLIVRIREGRVDETLYGRSVRKGTERIGWIEVHFVVGEPLKFVGRDADLLRSLLEEEYGVRDLTLAAEAPASQEDNPASMTGRAIPAPMSHSHRTAFSS